jgi:hypothetical protein
MVMPFKIQDTDYDYTANLEQQMNSLEDAGYSVLTVIPGVPASTIDGNEISGLPPKLVFHKSPFADLVAQVLALIEQLDSAQISQLIDGLPDRVTDPICERCDLVDDDELVSTIQDAKALIANSSDSNTDEIPW